MKVLNHDAIHDLKNSIKWLVFLTCSYHYTHNLFNPFQSIVSTQIETCQLIYTSNQVTGFYMKPSPRMICFNQQPWNKSYSLIYFETISPSRFNVLLLKKQVNGFCCANKFINFYLMENIGRNGRHY